jgi:hypothetical protein
MGSIKNSSIEGTSWGNGGMDLLDLKNSSEGPGGQDVDLDIPHGLESFIHHLCPMVLQLLLVSKFLQHLPEHLRDFASITSVMQELANIPIRKMNP